ncbi:hypothetical protein ATERTT37_002702 [Aspergillus terreus]
MYHREESEVPRQDRTRRDSHPGGGYRVESDPQPRRHTGRDLARRHSNRPVETKEEADGVDHLSPALANVHLNGELADTKSGLIREDSSNKEGQVHDIPNGSHAIYTYKNRGVSKNAADASKHAIVYMEGSRPTASSLEPRMLSKALEIQPISDDHKLSPMSRLNFGKLFTVEHNVKVAPVGRITDRSMPDFLAYARREIWV